MTVSGYSVGWLECDTKNDITLNGKLDTGQIKNYYMNYWWIKIVTFDPIDTCTGIYEQNILDIMDNSRLTITGITLKNVGNFSWKL